MRIGAYTIERPLGSGGMSQVWLARDAFNRTVVVKRQLNPADDSRLRDEGRIGLRLRHDGVVQTFDLFEHEGRPVLVLEYVAGSTLAALRKHGPLPAEAVASIGADVAAGLAALHAATDESGAPLRAVHRDVSPANIIVAPDGRARLIDLGIARSRESSSERTRAGDVRGTIRYLAPELFDAAEHSPRTDLWALGVCLFEAALGRPAATGPEATLLAAVLRGTLLQLHDGESISPHVAAVIGQLCAPADERIDDASVAAARLRDAERHCGDGRAAASCAVYASAGVAPPPLTQSVSVPAGDAARLDSAPRSKAAAELVDALEDETRDALPGVARAAVEAPLASAHAASVDAEDPFGAFAAATYCGGGDDDPFGEEPPAHAERVMRAVDGGEPMPSAPGDASPGPLSPEDPRFDSVVTAAWRAPPAAASSVADPWALPPSNTGSGEEPRPQAALLPTAPLPSAAWTEPTASELVVTDPMHGTRSAENPPPVVALWDRPRVVVVAAALSVMFALWALLR